MKAFLFRLDQALRWRATQVNVEKAKVSAAANSLSQIQNEVAQREAELRKQSFAIASSGSDGTTLVAWGAWEARTRATIQKLRAAEQQAQAVLAAQMMNLAEANRRWQLIDNLKIARKANWNEDFAKELETFAAESFLGRLQSKRKGA